VGAAAAGGGLAGGGRAACMGRRRQARLQKVLRQLRLQVRYRARRRAPRRSLRGGRLLRVPGCTCVALRLLGYSGLLGAACGRCRGRAQLAQYSARRRGAPPDLHAWAQFLLAISPTMQSAPMQAFTSHFPPNQSLDDKRQAFKDKSKSLLCKQGLARGACLRLLSCENGTIVWWSSVGSFAVTETGEGKRLKQAGSCPSMHACISNNVLAHNSESTSA
jgi:hypothetical protein